MTHIIISMTLTVSHDNSIWKIGKHLGKATFENLFAIKTEATILIALK